MSDSNAVLMTNKCFFINIVLGVDKYFDAAKVGLSTEIGISQFIIRLSKNIIRTFLYENTPYRRRYENHSIISFTILYDIM